MTWDNLWKILGLIVAATTMLFGVGRYVGTMEQRIKALEDRQQYLHGDIEVPRPQGVRK